MINLWLFFLYLTFFFSSSAKANIDDHLLGVSQSPCRFDTIDCIYVTAVNGCSLETIKCEFDYYSISPIVISLRDVKITSETIDDMIGNDWLTDWHLRHTICHLSVWKDACEKKHKTIWVLEENTCFFDKAHNILKYIDELNQCDPEWDILYTDNRFAYTNGKYNYYVSPNIRKIDEKDATQSMIISNRGIKKLVDYFENNKLSYRTYLEIQNITDLRLYVLDKSLTVLYRND